MEHDVGKRHVSEIDERPRGILLHRGDDVEKDFGEEDENDVNDPCAFVVDPVSVSVEASRLV